MRSQWMGLAAFGCSLECSGGATAGPGVGDPAPDFSLMGSDGRLHSLAEYRGRKAVVLAWFAQGLHPRLNGGARVAA